MIQPQPMEQQVVVTDVAIPKQQFEFKSKPIYFWVVVTWACLWCILSFSTIASGTLYGLSILVFVLAVCFYAATLYSLEIRSTQTHLYVGFGPLAACFCHADTCLQRVSIPYEDIESFEQVTNDNKCWYPSGYAQGFYDDEESNFVNCFLNTCCRCCSCTNTWFLNGGFKLCLFTVSLKDLIILKLKTPLTYSCYSFNQLAISVDDGAQLGGFLQSLGVKGEGDLTIVPQQQPVSVQENIPQQPIPVQPVQVNIHQNMPVTMQPQPIINESQGWNQPNIIQPNITQPNVIQSI